MTRMNVIVVVRSTETGGKDPDGGRAGSRGGRHALFLRRAKGTWDIAIERE
jgi:hypothetical protein